MEQKKVDIFGSFLSGSSMPASTTGAAPPADLAPPPSPPPAPDLERALLAMLARSEQPIDLKVLLAETLGSPTQAIQILEDMEKVKLVERVEHEGDGRSYRATPLGKDLYGAR